MMDLAAKAGISYDLNALSKKLGIPVVPINARNGVGLEELKKVMGNHKALQHIKSMMFGKKLRSR